MKWSFIWTILGRYGFNTVFISRLTTLFQNVKISILMDGAPYGYFACSQGVRQGDPLSAIIFALASNYLSLLINNAVRQGEIDPINAARGINCPSHLMYADDTILFMKGNCKSISSLTSILSHYEEVSGQGINWNKSSVYFGKGISRSSQHFILNTLAIKEGEMPFYYLGVPLFMGAPRNHYFLGIYEKIKMQLVNWKGKSLSMAGRICLVNSVIYSKLV